MRIKLSVPENLPDEDIAGVLNAALEASTRANEALLKSGQTPDVEELLRMGAKWKPESEMGLTGGEHFDLGPEIARRLAADCDDWAPIAAATARVRGDVGAYPFVEKTGPRRWHAVFATGDGERLDPSVWAGMRDRRGVRGALVRPMAVAGQGALAVVPRGRRQYAARCDLPWDDLHVSGVGYGSTPERALEHALSGACIVGETLALPHTAILEHVGQMLLGDASEVGDLMDIVKSAVPLAAAAIPGAGAALPIAGSLLSAFGGGGGAPPAPPPGPPAPGTPQGMASMPFAGPFGPGTGTIAWNPNSPGPVIVRF